MARKIEYYCERCKQKIDIPNEFRYSYKNRSYHYDCLLKKLKLSKKPKIPPEEISIIIENARVENVTTPKKKVTVAKTTKAEYQEIQEQKQKLIHFIERRYKITTNLTPRIISTINALNNGKYSKIPDKKISYEQLLNMFTFYERELDYAHNYMNRKGDEAGLFFYDLTILLQKLSQYEYMISQSEKQRQTPITQTNIDVTAYVKGRNINDNEEDIMDTTAFWEDYE